MTTFGYTRVAPSVRLDLLYLVLSCPVSPRLTQPCIASFRRFHRVASRCAAPRPRVFVFPPLSLFFTLFFDRSIKRWIDLIARCTLRSALLARTRNRPARGSWMTKGSSCEFEHVLSNSIGSNRIGSDRIELFSPLSPHLVNSAGPVAYTVLRSFDRFCRDRCHLSSHDFHHKYVFR